MDECPDAGIVTPAVGSDYGIYPLVGAFSMETGDEISDAHMIRSVDTEGNVHVIAFSSDSIRLIRDGFVTYCDKMDTTS